MERFYSYRLGSDDGRVYHLSVSGAPSMNHVEDFAVAVHFNDADTDETVEIVRIDTSHGFVHIDRLYRADQPKDELDVETLWEAEALLREQWRRYAESYARNHE